MGDPSALLEAHALRAKPFLASAALCLRPRDHLALRKPAVGEIPDALLAAPADDGDLAARAHHLEHQPHLPCAPPAVSLAAGRLVILDLTGEERPAALEL